MNNLHGTNRNSLTDNIWDNIFSPSRFAMVKEGDKMIFKEEMWYEKGNLLQNFFKVEKDGLFADKFPDWYFLIFKMEELFGELQKEVLARIDGSETSKMNQLKERIRYLDLFRHFAKDERISKQEFEAPIIKSCLKVLNGWINSKLSESSLLNNERMVTSKSTLEQIQKDFLGFLQTCEQVSQPKKPFEFMESNLSSEDKEDLFLFKDNLDLKKMFEKFSLENVLATQDISENKFELFVGYLANDIAQVQGILFKQFKPYDFIDKNITQSKTENCFQMMEYSNRLTIFVRKQILEARNEDDRQVVIYFFCKLRERLCELHDFQSAVSINAGLDHSSITRLEAIWAQFNQVFSKQQKKNIKMKELFSHKFNFKNLRQEEAKLEGQKQSYLSSTLVFYRDFIMMQSSNMIHANKINESVISKFLEVQKKIMENSKDFLSKPKLEPKSKSKSKSKPEPKSESKSESESKLPPLTTNLIPLLKELNISEKGDRELLKKSYAILQPPAHILKLLDTLS